MDRALSALAAGRRSLSRAPSPTAPSNFDIVQRVHDLLDVSTSHYLPGAIDPDDHSVSEICKAEGESSLDDILAPLVMLMTRLALADDGAKVKIRELLLPADIDRTRSLESREDLLGRCLRLLASIHHARLKDGIGEMLFAICDSDGESPLIFADTKHQVDVLFSQRLRFLHRLVTAMSLVSYSTKEL
jgi:hypothetical protein